ncbi:MAG: ABC transporter ATP-binding protein/permease [Oscillospiraceae bacterium]|jgi:ATP-binding cassette subfamily B protein|nr:ABC transporter ATP-binding protein/permease [Oscillospiraceae bacterium]
MGKKKHNTKISGGKSRGFSKDVLALLEAEGLCTEGFLLTAIGDMDNDGGYCNAWVALDEAGLYIATGREAIYRDKKRKRLRAEARLSTLEAIPLRDMQELRVERYATTARLVAKRGGEEIALLRFSLGRAEGFARICALHGAIREGKEADRARILADAEEEKLCERCGGAMPKTGKCPRCSSKRSTAVRLYTFFGGYKKQVALLLFVQLILTVFNVAMPKVGTEMLFDDVLGESAAGLAEANKLAMLGWLVLAVLGLRVFGLLSNMASDYIQAIIMPKIAYDIKLKIFTAMQRLSVGFYSSKQTGQVMERITEDAMNVHFFFTDMLPFGPLHILKLIGVLVMMFQMDAGLSLVVLSILPPLLLLLGWGQAFFRRLHHKTWANHAKVTSLVSDNINGQRVIKVFSKEKEEMRRFTKLAASYRDAQNAYTKKETLVMPIFTALTLCLTAVAMTLGASNVLGGRMQLGELLAFVLYINMLAPPLEYLSFVATPWAKCADSAHRIFEVTDSEPDIVEPEHPVVLPDFRGSVELLELDFEYEPAHPIIKKLHLKVEAGQMLGIVGKTGAGKTTIANLISRLYDPKAGSVRIDGVDVKELSFAQLRQNIGLVSQDIYLFGGSVLENIRYGKPDATVSEVIAAAKTAAAHDFILCLPDGYETRVGNGGQELSGGERQRVSIARAILQNPKILILDEATAAMDTATERSIQESLGKLKKGRTTIAIAHRLSTLRGADLLAVIEGGELKEFGSFETLLKQKGEFYKLYQTQQKALAAVSSIAD